MLVEQAKAVLREKGYFVSNLWSVNDVKDKYKCTDEVAQDILESALTNEATKEQIWLAIKLSAEDKGLEKK